MADGEKSGGGGSTAIVAIVAICVLAAIAYFVVSKGMIGGDGKKIEADVKIETPSAPATK